MVYAARALAAQNQPPFRADFERADVVRVRLRGYIERQTRKAVRAYRGGLVAELAEAENARYARELYRAFPSRGIREVPVRNRCRHGAGVEVVGVCVIVDGRDGI